ncbi:MAG TPA: TonB-dependent receptor plug domain-containing protein [Gemmatimonadaceae bacterium]|jgi:hypothetical protein|nr:TonB-dependent receptor plug domain-containing protein [Gemmatimonadaceae bacterium]
MNLQVSRLLPFSHRALFLAAPLFVVAGATSAWAQQVRFRVTSDTLDTPVPKAQIVSLNDRAVWRTNDDGIILLTASHSGANVFSIRHLGLAPISVTIDVPEHGTRAVHVIMDPAPQRLDTVSIKERALEPQLSAFDERRTHNPGGHFITWSDIERQQPRETLDLFRRVLGLQVRMINAEPQIVSTRGIGTAGFSCRPGVGLDGMVFTSDFDVNDIPPSAIYGVEIYNGGSTIPSKYLASAAQSTCGLIMIWTMDGARHSSRSP